MYDSWDAVRMKCRASDAGTCLYRSDRKSTIIGAQGWRNKGGSKTVTGGQSSRQARLSESKRQQAHVMLSPRLRRFDDATLMPKYGVTEIEKMRHAVMHRGKENSSGLKGFFMAIRAMPSTARICLDKQRKKTKQGSRRKDESPQAGRRDEESRSSKSSPNAGGASLGVGNVETRELDTK